MTKVSKSKTQARLKEQSKSVAKNGDAKASRLAVPERLKEMGHEIEVRVGKLNQHTGKAVDMRNSIDCLLTEAEKLCDPKGFTFETFGEVLPQAWAVASV